MKSPAALLALSLPALSACVSGPSEDIASARAAWKAHEPARYAYTVRTVCFCAPESVQVIATRDSVLAARNYSAQTGEIADVYPDRHYSIDSLFDRLEAWRASKPYQLRFSFNPEYHFPDTVEFDGIKNAVDDELTIEITDFHPEALP